MDRAKHITSEIELVKVQPFREDETIEAEEARERRRGKFEENTATLEALAPVTANGNGTEPISLWETAAATSIFGIATQTEYAPILEELTEVRQKLWETEQEKRELHKFYEYWLSKQYDAEALATSNEDAMVILSRFASTEALPVADLEKGNEAEQWWLALLRLVQANFVSYLGSYLYITARGKRVLDAVLNHGVGEKTD